MDAAQSAHPTRQVLNSYSLGRLAAPFAVAVSKHLERCPDCRHQAAEMSADNTVTAEPTWYSLIDLEQTESLRKPASAVVAARRPISTWILPATVAASFCGILALVVMIWVATENRRIGIVSDGPSRAETKRHDSPSTKTTARGSGSRPVVSKSQRGKEQASRDPMRDFTDRLAAVSVLRLGGSVTTRVNGRDQSVGPGEALPTEALQVTHVRLGEQPGLTDAGLALVDGLTNLVDFRLSKASKVTDAGVARLGRLPNLERLVLDGTSVTDKGLVYFRGLSQLKELSLRGTKVTAAGLEGLKKSLPACRFIADDASLE